MRGELGACYLFYRLQNPCSPIVSTFLQPCFFKLCSFKSLFFSIDRPRVNVKYDSYLVAEILLKSRDDRFLLKIQLCRNIFRESDKLQFLRFFKGRSLPLFDSTKTKNFIKYQVKILTKKFWIYFLSWGRLHWSSCLCGPPHSFY